MTKIDYRNEKTNFFNISSFVRKNRLEHISALTQAFEQNAFIESNKNLLFNFINSINPIIEKYMTDNSIYILMDKKNIFIAKNDYDITQKLIKLIDNQIKTFEIK